MPKIASTNTHRFQSAPLTDVRGDVAQACDVIVCTDVSIRSPHGCKGRSNALHQIDMTEVFQSAPLTDVRGDSS